MSPSDDKPLENPVPMITTEHFTLQTARSSTVAESSGRTASYLSTLSSALLALTLLANATEFGTVFVVSGLVLGAVLWFVGLVTFLRLLETSIEDVFHARGINRIRRFYLDNAPSVEPYLIQSAGEEVEDLMRNMALEPGTMQVFLTSAGMVSVINSVVLAAILGGVAQLLAASLAVSFTVAAATFALSLGWYTWYQNRAWRRFQARFRSHSRP